MAGPGVATAALGFNCYCEPAPGWSVCGRDEERRRQPGRRRSLERAATNVSGNSSRRQPAASASASAECIP
jgi:hypothetical protein